MIRILDIEFEVEEVIEALFETVQCGVELVEVVDRVVHVVPQRVFLLALGYLLLELLQLLERAGVEALLRFERPATELGHDIESNEPWRRIGGRDIP